MEIFQRLTATDIFLILHQNSSVTENGVMTMELESRHYESTDLPTFKANTSPKKKEELLKVLYSETNSNYRNLADIRFKLLGFVPAVSVIAWAELLSKLPVEEFPIVVIGLTLSLLGMRITYGVRIYDMRNDQLYDDLVRRGRKIEEEMGVHTGIFKGRLDATRKDRVFKKIIKHGRGLSLIYSSVFIGWGLLIIWYAFNIVKLLIKIL